MLAAMHSKTGIGLTTGLLVFAMCLQSSLYAQSKVRARPQEHSARVPFVGCPSDGQVGPEEAPTGDARFVPIATEAADRLSYYESAQKLGVLAPRGWYCFGTYGSNGESLYVSPHAISAADLFSTDWRGFVGPVIQISHEYGGTSGRFGVARVIARVFPTHKAFVDRIIKEGIAPEGSFPFGPYPADKLVYKTKEVVEYQTPPQQDGLGTNSRLKKNETPISGVAILRERTPNLVLLAVRLSPDLADLAQMIIRQVERDAEHSND